MISRTARRGSPTALVLVGALLLGGCLRFQYDRCDDDPPHPECADAGQDAGLLDAGAEDAGSAEDAASSEDAARSEDAASSEDAGGAEDAGASEDAGGSEDAAAADGSADAG